MHPHAGYHRAQVLERIDWTADLFSLRVGEVPLTFEAGQFTKLAVEGEDGQLISRAYSLVNAPDASQQHEFLIAAAPQGKLSPRLQALSAGETIWVGESAHGDLVKESIVPHTDNLWLLATGTGIGPFLSLLLDHKLTQSNIVLVHGVRFARDLVYAEMIQTLLADYQGRLSYHPVVSREPVEGALPGRIPALIEAQTLQQAAQCELSPHSSFAMLCGNPEMIKDSIKALQNQGLQRYRHATGGHIIHERYW